MPARSSRRPVRATGTNNKKSQKRPAAKPPKPPVRPSAKRPAKQASRHIAKPSPAAPPEPIHQKMVEGLQTLEGGAPQPLRLVRPEEYEDLTAPLREFTRVSPALVEALAALPRLGSVLAMSAERMDRAADRIEKGERAAAQARSNEVLARLADAAVDLDDVRQTLLIAISTIPREEDYRPTARQLRELASVSPSLLEWLNEVPKLTAPLADSLTALREAAERLAAARAAITAALRALAPVAERDSAIPPAAR